jgi:hypothetical protein
MITDKQLLFDDGAAITATAASTNVIDLSTFRDVATGRELHLLCQVGTAFTAAGAATLQVQIQGSVDNSTYTTMSETVAIAKTALTAGARLFDIGLPRPAPGQSLPRYLRLNYIVATGPMTAGTVTSTLLLDRQDYVGYPPGVVVNN